MEVTYRRGERRDLPALGNLYLLAFADSVRQMHIPDLSPLALGDLLGACLRADRDAITVAEVSCAAGVGAAAASETRIVGYVVAVANAHHVWRAPLLWGLGLVWIWRWATGRYHLPLPCSFGVFRDKLRLWAVWRSSPHPCPARILSMAVHPEWQRRGIGSALLARALAHLRARGCGCVGLEVRDDNVAAQALYARHGFRKVARFDTTRGGWEVMLLALGGGHPPGAGTGAASRAGKKRRLRRFILLLFILIALIGGHAWLLRHLAWKAALRKAGFTDEMASPGRGDRILVVAPHPDDEILGCGGLIQQAVAEGAEVDVVLMTNGDASELAVIFGEKELPLSPQSYVALGRKRQGETLRALGMAGVPRQRVHFLSFPNNGLTALWRPEHWLYSHPYASPYTHASASPYQRSYTPQAPYCGLQVLSDLVSVLNHVRPTAVYVTHPQDIHSDHWVTSAFVRYALATVAARGGQWAQETKVYGYLVHWPRFPVPQSLQMKLGLLPPADLQSRGAESPTLRSPAQPDYGAWLRLPLSGKQVARKLTAIMAYRSQMPRFDGLLKSFARTNETFALLPTIDMEWDRSRRWRDENSRRRGLGGAEMREVDLTVMPNGAVRADVDTSGRSLGKRTYVALDLRTWDDQGAPVITTLYLSQDGALSAQRVVGVSEQPLTARVRRAQPSGTEVFELEGFEVPLHGKEGVFVTCWGSVNDRVVDPAVVSWVRLPATR